jgi:REP element-mobilizing transposase RayT
MGRGIEGRGIFTRDKDRGDFLRRLGEICESGGRVIHAWAFMPNHFHLLVRSGNRPLGISMRGLLRGYAINFNLRYGRGGHLFQNRYRSIVCEEDPYLLELTRYIYLIAIRAGLVKDMRALGPYAGTGHSAIVGEVKRPWQDTETVLGYLGRIGEEPILKSPRLSGQVGALGFGQSEMPPFELHRGEVAEARMPTMEIIPALDVVEHSQTGSFLWALPHPSLLLCHLLSSLDFPLASIPCPRKPGAAQGDLFPCRIPYWFLS